MDGLTVGRIVHYVFENDNFDVVHRAAIITQVWSKADGVVNLLVFPDGSNDVRDGEYADAWKTSVRYSNQHELNTWHWIEKA